MSLSGLLSTQISQVKRLKNQNAFAIMCYMILSVEASDSGNDNYTQITINKKFLVSLLQLFLLHLLHFTFGVGEQTSVSCFVILCVHPPPQHPSSSLYSSNAPSEAPENRGETVKIKTAPGASWRSRISDRRCGLFSGAGYPQSLCSIQCIRMGNRCSSWGQDMDYF